jgi:hypothetical protein
MSIPVLNETLLGNGICEGCPCRGKIKSESTGAKASFTTVLIATNAGSKRGGVLIGDVLEGVHLLSQLHVMTFETSGYGPTDRADLRADLLGSEETQRWL